MIVNSIGYEVIKTAINGVKGWRTRFHNLGTRTGISFSKAEVEVVFLLNIEGGDVTYMIYRGNKPVTKEKEVLSRESVRDILGSFEEDRNE